MLFVAGLILSLMGYMGFMFSAEIKSGGVPVKDRLVPVAMEIVSFLLLVLGIAFLWIG